MRKRAEDLRKGFCMEKKKANEFPGTEEGVSPGGEDLGRPDPFNKIIIHKKLGKDLIQHKGRKSLENFLEP